MVVDLQYLGQIVSQITQSSGIEVSEDMLSLEDSLYTINMSWPFDNATTATRRSQALSLSQQLVQIPLEEAISGTLWLFPSAVSPLETEAAC